MKLTIAATPAQWSLDGIKGVTTRFDAEHEQLFTFALDAEHELVALRAVVQGKERAFLNTEAGQAAPAIDSTATLSSTKIYADGQWHDATIYDRAKLKPQNNIAGPAIVSEMDSTTLILPKHTAFVDAAGNLVITPDGHASKTTTTGA